MEPTAYAELVSFTSTVIKIGVAVGCLGLVVVIGFFLCSGFRINMDVFKR